MQPLKAWTVVATPPPGGPGGAPRGTVRQQVIHAVGACLVLALPAARVVLVKVVIVV